ncbi:hypothetical protein T11_3842 [Trichinella zimbabwensis]|uniref:Uncharacterized protein n=1 Tax=Trichinella zimbabwensis TaxID=268475 RepID=A0A0V1GJL5_9BILA|nr:hypothetical protein T11_3842 [Trichinella zimbabwensis]
MTESGINAFQTIKFGVNNTPKSRNVYSAKGLSEGQCDSINKDKFS